ncbi:hypothetical protein MPUL_46610 [Mycolicibacterium pulveris]|uniref:Secreted protein n=1 Tax=Mycolicibacterium pulveris TaxID=36813 RepID=A0A7I7URQ2_MYCPV|nr:hypothetical protein MPUL_46610 [Mycolicibacterium pulveris]
MIVAAAAVVAAPLAPALTNGVGAAGASDNTFMPFSQILRRCDFSETDYNSPTGQGRPTANIRSDGSSVSADVQLVLAIPNIPYEVRLIQVPRPSSAPCWGADPGVAQATLHTDGAGAGAVTLSDAIEPGATGVWVFVTRPDPFSQNPAEFYTTDLIAKL